ncbi:seryl-tRNA synthetase [Candidatus Phytoplasma luffae]|uniref:Serine--tRNA ligase n=1 Tax=Loofah witches'-broom phytoplasma TaxID=35773 RepID=A0A975INE6_LOWBP|nr:serine--tRNA ligase [Candidatus Phytoplasma luffae]QTX02766.1 seryl-tRNA synthetase [Candidatus Phytoplasma luffae]
MLDFKFVLENMDLILNKLKNRKIDVSDFKEIIIWSDSRKELIHKIEKIRFNKNNISNSISKLKYNNESYDHLLLKDKNSKKELKQLEIKLKEVENKILSILHNMPNIPHDSIPIGSNEQDNVEIFRYLEPKKFLFPIKDNVELGQKLDILDFEKAAKITGSKFVVLKGLGAKLERSLINFMIDIHASKGYTEVLPPFIVNEKSMFSTGQLPKFEKEMFKLKSDKNNWYLNPTAEVPIINLHRDTVLKLEQLPLKYVGYTTCFRQEAGAAGKDTKGIFRQKQFNKVELIQFVEPKNSYKALEQMLKDSEFILQKLNLPYRIVVLSTGDLGFSVSKTYDIEVWIPSQGKYCEIASISNSEDFQARRANIKFVSNEKNKKQFLHILNGSALAIGRTMMAIMENFQDENGHIIIPEALHNYFGRKIIK